ncbi:MAG: VanZ family protein [Thermoleophilia bacterium]|nr:VanZ family protein [Thermoleophilia bacterium]
MQPPSSEAPRNRKLLPWLAVAAWAGLIFFFSAQPSLSTGLGIWDIILRKAAHMAVFGVLSLLVWRAVRQHDISNAPALAIGAVTALLYAFSDEYHQSFVEGRTASLGDVGFDLAGIIIATALAALALRRSGRLRSASRRTG